MAKLTGETVGSYRILERIGRGGMATVYKAYQPSLDRYVAIKILPPYFSQEEGFEKRFRREARAVAKLEHPHILAVHDFGQADDLSYIVMRYIDAGTLKDLAGQPISLQKVTEIIGQIADALDYAHEHDVVHRDVKPSNVLLDRGEWALLTDFGVARMLSESQQLTATGVGIGTPDYMSPEQAKGEKADHRSDVYSLGVVLYELLTGQVPFQAETPMAVVLKHIYEPLTLPSEINPDIPEDVERVVLKALSKDPADRYASAGDLASDLKDTVGQLEAQGVAIDTLELAPTVLEGEEVARPFRLSTLRRWWWIAPAGITLVLLGLVFGGGLLKGGEDGEDARPIALEATQVIRTEIVQVEKPSEALIETAAVMPTATVEETLLEKRIGELILYDDFDYQFAGGQIDYERWIDKSWGECETKLEDGRMVVSNEIRDDGCESRMVIQDRAGVRGDQIGTIEAQMQISSDRIGGTIEQNIAISTIIMHENWSDQPFWILCGVLANDDGPVTFFEVGGPFVEYLHLGSDAKYDTWYTIRVTINPENMAISCYKNGISLGTRYPNRPDILGESEFEVRLHAWRPPGSYGTTFVENVRISQ